jgi:hypothetical protein
MFSGQFCPFQMFLGVQTNSGFIDRHSNYVPLPVGDCCFLSGDEPHAGAAFNDSNTRIFGEASSKVGRGYGPLSQHFFDEEIATHLSASSSVIKNGMLDIVATISSIGQDKVDSKIV